MAIDLASVFNSDSEFFLEVDKDVSNILLRKRKLCLWTLALASHVEGQSFLRTRGVAESSTRVVIGTLRLECHTASYLSVWPNLSLEWLDGEDLVLEQHRVIIHSLADALVLSLKSSNCFLLSPLPLKLQFGIVV